MSELLEASNQTFMIHESHDVKDNPSNVNVIDLGLPSCKTSVPTGRFELGGERPVFTPSMHA